MKKENWKEELNAMVHAGYPIISVNTADEIKAVKQIKSIFKSETIWEWSISSGLLINKKAENNSSPEEVLINYEQASDSPVLILYDYQYYLTPYVTRKLREMSKKFKVSNKTIIFVSVDFDLPLDLSTVVETVDVPVPRIDDYKKLIISGVEAINTSRNSSKINLNEEELKELASACTGLTLAEAENVLSKSFSQTGTLDSFIVRQSKKQIIKNSGVLEFIDVPQDKSSVGGLENLKDWLDTRRKGFSDEAQEEGLQYPKGLLLAGLPGCGKSLTAIAVAQEWKMPLLRLDIGKIYGKYVGDSEKNIRKALDVAEKISPCILWIDEIEKGLGGSGGDGGTSSRVLGTILTWMQEKTDPVFVLATANDTSVLPPELIRKGRMDEVFFVDLPNLKERQEIFKIAVDKNKWKHELDFKKLASESVDFSGAEVAQSILDGKYTAFNNNEILGTKHVLEALKSTIPLSSSMKDKISILRDWAKSSARPASRDIDEDDEEINSFGYRANKILGDEDE
jgi:hypothetical protein